MAAKAGRLIELLIVDGTEETLVAALTSKKISITGENIDITSDDDAGWTKLLEDTYATQSVSIDAEGVCKDDVMGALLFGDSYSLGNKPVIVITNVRF